MSRVRAVLRRSMPKNIADENEEDKIESKGILLDIKRRRVFVNGNDVELTFKEFELLLYLMKNSGIALSPR